MPVKTTIVVPTRHESENIEPFISRIVADCASELPDIEIMFVDDSDDDTPRIIEQAARKSPIPVTVVHRIPEQRTGRLAGAVLHGIRTATTDTVVVMDADLQHRAADVPRLVRRLHDDNLDLVVGSRRVPGGSDEGLDGRYRKIVSRGASAAARVTFPRKVGSVRDVSSGFYSLRRSAIDIDSIHTDGYKILLTTLVHRQLAVAEEPIIFLPRHNGESKATVQEGFRYVRLLARLRMSATATTANA